MLGIVIGVAAVIVMVTLGQGTTAQVTSDVAKLGSNLLMVRPGQAGAGPGERVRRHARLHRQGPEGDRRPGPGGRGGRPGGVQSSMTAIYGNLNHSQSVTGTDNAYLVARDWTVDRGRAFSDGELSAGSAVCILGDTVADALFGDGDPIGETIRLKQISCRVIGTLEEKGASGFGTDQDDVILMPLGPCSGASPAARTFR